MQIIKNIIKFLLSKILTLSFLERLSQNIIHRKIIRIKKPRIVSNVNGSLKSLSTDSWNDLLRHKVWERIPEYISTNNDIIYMEFGVWEGHSINYKDEKLQLFDLPINVLKPCWIISCLLVYLVDPHFRFEIFHSNQIEHLG